MSLSGAPQSSPQSQTTQLFGLVVHSAGWDERLDELCGILAGRFNMPAGAARSALRQNGQTPVSADMTIQQVSALIEELSLLGVVAEASVQTPSEPQSTIHVGWASVATRPHVPAGDSTIIGMPNADESLESEAHASVTESSTTPEQAADDALSAWTEGAARARAAAIRAAMGGAAHSTPVATHRPSAAAPSSDSAPRSSPPPVSTTEQPSPVSSNTIISEDERVAAVKMLVAGSSPTAASAWGDVIGAPVAVAPVTRAVATPENLPTSDSAAPAAESELLSVFDALRGDATESRPSEVKDRAFERLRQPADTSTVSAASGHAWKAGLLSALAPGAGQAYNSEHSRAVTFALAGLFVVPWVVSVIDAFKRARSLDASGRFVPAPARTVVSVVIGFWGLVGALGVLYAAMDMATEPDPPPRVVVTPPSPAPREPVAAPDPQLERQRALIEEQQRVERQERVAGLVARARLACDAGDYVECRRLAEDALEIDESDPGARRVHVEAVVGQSGSSIDYPQPEPDE